jgi:ParB-like chromosome segregation protein Spo0J
MSVKKPVRELTVRAPFKDLFEIDPEVLEATVASIKRDGFDPERPIFAWRHGAELVVIDGHTRLAAAKKARLPEVPVVARKFANENEAFAFGIAAQRDRRNLTKEQIATAIARAELARAEPIDLATPARSMGGSPKGRQGGGGSMPDPVKQAVVDKAAKAGVGKRTAEKGLANARAERKPAKAAALPEPVTVAELKGYQARALVAARAVGPRLTALATCSRG